MTEHKHTPGPWKIEVDHWGNVDAISEGGMVIAEKVGYDAHLISAAPDMLEALEASEESIVTFMGLHGYMMDSGAGDILGQIRAAITKAKGQDQ